MRPIGLKNVESFQKTLQSMNWSKIAVWADGSWSAMHKASIQMQSKALFSINIENFQEFDKSRINSFVEDMHADLQFTQKSLLKGY